MDILTQGLLGGVLAQSIARREEKSLATMVGVVAGLLADADILIRSTSDPLLNIEYHRHFTHSLLFIPLGAAIAFALLWPFLRQKLSTGRLYLFCLTGFSMSGVLDACTSYGTHLFWPFSDDRVAWNIISIVDPVFTLVLLASLLLGLKLRNFQVARIGILFCGLYLGLGFIQLQHAQRVADELVQLRGHQPEQHVVKPTLGNLLLWRSVYINDNKIHADAIRLGLLDGHRVFEGESVEQFSVGRELPNLDSSSQLYRDIERFRSFSNGYTAYDPGQPNVIGDIRYSMLPVSVRPLWGIVIYPDQPDRHADYRFFRDSSPEIRRAFLKMLFEH
jgi:inner membrane protein